jgi:hypothetical protein
LCAWADYDFQQQARFARHRAMCPMLSHLRTIVFLIVWTFGAGKTIEITQFDVLCDDASDHSPVGGFGL